MPEPIKPQPTTPTLRMFTLAQCRFAGAIALAGMLLTFTAPTHRVDLLVYGIAAMVGGTLWYPTIGPAIVAASLPTYFFGRPLLGSLAFSPPELALAASWIAVLVQASRHELVLRWPRTPFDAPLALFVAAGLLSLSVTEYPLLSIRELRAMILEPVLFFWLLAVFPVSRSPALRGFLLAAVFTAALAVGQTILGWGGTEAEGVRRAQAWYPSPNHLALMLGRALPFCLARALAHNDVIWWLGTLVLGVALLSTFSTGGWLGGAAAIVVVTLVLRRRRLAMAVAGGAAAGLILVSSLAIGGRLPERFNPLRQTGGFRVELWASSIEMVRDHPVLGIGLDNFAYLYQQVYLREAAAAEPNLSHPHNWVLNFWLELGIAGLAAFSWLVVRAFSLAARQWTPHPDPLPLGGEGRPPGGRGPG